MKELLLVTTLVGLTAASAPTNADTTVALGESLSIIQDAMLPTDYGNITNHGVLNNYGQLTVGISSYDPWGIAGLIESDGEINNYGQIVANHGSIFSTGTINNYGSISNVRGVYKGAYLNLGGVLYNHGTMDLKDTTYGGAFYNMPDGVITMTSGTGPGPVEIQGAVFNSGNFTFGSPGINWPCLNCSYTQTNGITTVDSELTTPIDIQGGILRGAFSIASSVTISGDAIWEFNIGAISGSYTRSDVTIQGGMLDFIFPNDAHPKLGDSWTFFETNGNATGLDSAQFKVEGIGGGHEFSIIAHSNNPPDPSNVVTSYMLTVVAVPEPETYAMLLAGLGMVGAAARRRKACCRLI